MIPQEVRDEARDVADMLEKMAKDLRAAADAGTAFVCRWEKRANTRDVWIAERFGGKVLVSTHSTYELGVGPLYNTLCVDYTERVPPADQQREESKLYARARSR